MKFRTPIAIKPFTERVDYSSRILTLGSCFAAEIGARLRDSKFSVEVNPTGVLFNPASICATLQRFAQKRFISTKELHEGAEGWFHYDFHSSLSALDAEECAQGINHAIERGHDALVGADWVVLTLGTAWIYSLAQSGEVVANCHKQPHSTFVRRRKSVAEIVSQLSEAIETLLPHKKIILTLSPVRHLGDGLSENSLSKATLRVAIEEVVAQFPQRVWYFPAYEILVDDLRDYRFYGDDMTHPSPMAVDYVWQNFCEAAISEVALKMMARVERIVQAKCHRPINPTSEAHKKFCREQLLKIAELEGVVDMTAEREYFFGQI